MSVSVVHRRAVCVQNVWCKLGLVFKLMHINVIEYKGKS